MIRWLADSYAWIKSIHIISMVAWMAGLLYVPVFGLWAVTLARVLHGLGEGFFMTATVAWVVDLAPATARGVVAGRGGGSVGDLRGDRRIP